jgi:hypothetical protein
LRFFEQQRSNRARFFSLWLCTSDESRQTPMRIKRRPTSAFALAAWPSRKNVGTAPHPKGFDRTVAAGNTGANLRMAYGAGDPLSLQLVTTIRRPFSVNWLQPQSPYLAHLIVVVPQAKQRVTSNGLPSFRM